MLKRHLTGAMEVNWCGVDLMAFSGIILAMTFFAIFVERCVSMYNVR